MLASHQVRPIADAVRGANKIAIVRLGGIGDVIATLPIAWLLHDIAPTARIAWIAHAGPAQLLQHVKVIDEVLVLPRSNLFTAIRPWRKIVAGRDIDTVIDLHGNLKSAVVDWLTGARNRVGFNRLDCRERWNLLATNLRLPPLGSGNKTKRALEVGALLGHSAPAARFGIEFSPEEEDRATSTLGQLSKDLATVVLQLGRSGDVRSWPPERCAELCQKLLAHPVQIIVVGGPSEIGMANAVRRLLGPLGFAIRFEVGTLSICEIGALLHRLATDAEHRNVFIGPDCGPLHLSAAVGLRTIGLYGPQDPERTGPTVLNCEAIFHPRVSACIPCGRRECVHPIQGICMLSIGADEVIERALSSVPPSPRELKAVNVSLARSVGWPLFLLSMLPGLFGWIGAEDAYTALSLAVTPACTSLTAALLAARMGTVSAGIFTSLTLLCMAAFAWPAAIAPVIWVRTALLSASQFLLFGALTASEKRGRWWLGFVSFFVTTVLVNGGVESLAIPGLSFLIFLAGEKAFRRLSDLRILVGAAALSMMAIGWIFFDLPTLFGQVPIPKPVSLAQNLSEFVVWSLPASVVAPLVLFDHFKTRKFREDHGFADRRWRFPKAAFVAALSVFFIAHSPECLLLAFASLAILVGAWLDRWLLKSHRTGFCQ